MAQFSDAQTSSTHRPTVCYLILAHHKFDLLLRIVDRLAGPGVGFVFHIDKKVPAAQFEQVRRDLAAKVPQAAFAQRVDARWASYDQALAIMRCVQCALDDLPPFDRYVLASGQCYPTMSGSAVAALFARQPNAEFIEILPLDTDNPDESYWSPYYCYRRYHVWLSAKKWRPIPFLLKSRPPLPMYRGSTWWALTHAALSSVRRQFEENRKFNRQMRSSLFVDEAYIHTLIMNSPVAANIVRANLTYADFSKSAVTGPHPKMLLAEDLPAIIASGKILARKVDPALDATLLDLLDQRIAAGEAHSDAGG